MVNVSIDQRGEHSYRLRTRWVNEEGQPREVSETVKGTRDVAEAKKAIILGRFKSGQMVSMSEDSVGGYIQNWLDQRQLRGEIRETTAQCYRGVLPRFITVHGDKKLIAVTAQNLRDWVKNSLPAHGPYLTRYVGTIVKKAFKQAVKEGAIPFNPWDQVDLPAPKGSDREHSIGSDELRQVFDTADREGKFGLAVKLCLETGARRGELAGLRWCDISETGVVTINRTVVVIYQKREKRYGKASPNLLKVTEPKTKRGKRKVRVSDTMRDEINYLRIGKSPTNYILSGTDEPLHPCTVSSGMQRVLKAAGIEGRSAHDIRHAHATHLLRSGVPVAAVSKRMGHSKTSITFDTYAHALEEDEDHIVNAIDTVLR